MGLWCVKVCTYVHGRFDLANIARRGKTSCTSHLLFLFTFTKVVFVSLDENDELCDEHDEYHVWSYVLTV